MSGGEQGEASHSRSGKGGKQTRGNFGEAALESLSDQEGSGRVSAFEIPDAQD